MTELRAEVESPPCSPTSPRTPTTPATMLSDAATAIDSEPEKEAITSIQRSPTIVLSSRDAPGHDHDPESLQKLPRRPTLSESLKRAGTSLSSRIPPHWRTNYLSKGRHSQRIDDHPDGYPRFAAFMNSDENFLMARRYGLLHTRVMLYRQAELARLERELLALDKEDADEDDRALKGAKFLARGERGEYRMELIGKIEDKLKQYGE